jgi:hypothetical protein
LQLNQITDQQIAAQCLDIAESEGEAAARFLLAQALSGPVSIESINQYPDQAEFNNRLENYREQYLRSLVVQDPQQEATLYDKLDRAKTFLI